MSKILFSRFGKKAAIRNDIEIADNIFNSVNQSITSIFKNSEIQNNIFKNYSKTNNYLYSTDIIIDYKFNNTIFNFPISVHGRIIHGNDILKK